MNFSERLKLLRENKKMSQARLAMKLEVSRSAVNSWEQGVSMPTVENLMRLSDIFYCTTDYLLALDDKIYIEVTSVKPKDIEALRTIAETLRDKSR